MKFYIALSLLAIAVCIAEISGYAVNENPGINQLTESDAREFLERLADLSESGDSLGDEEARIIPALLGIIPAIAGLFNGR